jgi:hypothetical protein
LIRCAIIVAALAVMVGTGGLAWSQAQKASRRPAPINPAYRGPIPVGPFAVSAGQSSVTPGTVTFTSSNPGGGAVAGSSTATVTFKTVGNPAGFRIWAQALSSGFTGCNSPAASKVTVACQTATAGVTCAGASALSSSAPPSATLVASGSGNHTSTVTVGYTFQDAWNYQAGSACTLSVQYLYTEP